ncbi:uncharacterized protein LOC132194061 isoform X2 [Neocloeon triangulifer]|uniref:uncharacterized protein LOC132194061 isoform X2 n=1 Tax=Neocloeon triangulifer TaxID=2078957 RepID=UPI00286F3AC9|nr:uncharacterized protein LOC132194061 isoform X2 [Neocloeon triangulifer]XP_059471106.1 uncharacterized protein LOC132194061 isoform X2 [Neocloeon triangulifer]
MQEEPEKIPLTKKGPNLKKRAEKAAAKERPKVDPDWRLYLRFPHKIPEYTIIKEMHPLITNVSLPRQKSARFCFLEFESESDAQRALKELQDYKTTNGKKLFMSLGRKAEDDEGKLKFRIQKTGRKNVSVK